MAQDINADINEELDEAQDTQTSAPLKQPKPPFKKQQQQPTGIAIRARPRAA